MTGKTKEMNCGLLVIGSGPGGYVCAIRAGQLGVKTIIVDKQKPGGTCLNVGCIPSKAIIHAADEFYQLIQSSNGNSNIGIETKSPKIDFSRTIDWKDDIVRRLNNGVSGLLKKARVESIIGEAQFLDGKTVRVTTSDGTRIIKPEHVVIATGSNTVELPGLPFGGDIISSTDALSLTEIPKTLAVIGGGYIGLELGIAFAKLGSKVTVIEAAEGLLPQYDAELIAPVHDKMTDLGINVLVNTTAIRSVKKEQALVVGNGNDSEHQISAEKILVTVGRKPVTDGIGLEQLVLDMDGLHIKIDDHCRTSMRHIYAVGDVTGEPMLAHRAMAQGEMVAEIIAGKKRSWDKYCIPAVCFTDPEIISVGLSPDEAKARQIETKIGKFPLKASGRAMTTGREDGFVRVVARHDNHVVVGIQAVGARISELSAAFGLAIENAMRLEDVAATIHSHPTLGEGLQEASMDALGTPLHL